VAHGGPVRLVYIVGNRRQKGSEVVEREQSLRSNTGNQLRRLFALVRVGIFTPVFVEKLLYVIRSSSTTSVIMGTLFYIH